MAWICRFSACPAPTTAFLTRFGEYSAMRSPLRAGARSAMPRAWPSFSVARAFSLTNVSSTAASLAPDPSITLESASNSSLSR